MKKNFKEEYEKLAQSINQFQEIQELEKYLLLEIVDTNNKWNRKQMKSGFKENKIQRKQKSDKNR